MTAAEPPAEILQQRPINRTYHLQEQTNHKFFDSEETHLMFRPRFPPNSKATSQ